MGTMSSKLRGSLLVILVVAAIGIAWWALHRREKLTTPITFAKHVALEQKVPAEFRFVALGDTRFHDPSDTEASNPAVRRALVAAIEREHPAFISIGGDIVYIGGSAEDWDEWDKETKSWREQSIPVYPAIGNHELKGDLKVALGNYFSRFPQLQNSSYYSVRAGNCLMLALDSSLDETSGAQGDWLREQLDSIPAEVDFVFLVLHHPPYTSSSDEKVFGGGHSVRGSEQALATLLEERQQKMHARIVVFSSHVHNYERHQHNGITYFVTGGGGAHAYPVTRAADDLYKDPGINYHYLLVEVSGKRVDITMNKVEFKDGKEVWSEPDSVTIETPGPPMAAHAQ
jgi:Icc-related predicted phosphoesterase